MFLNSVQTFAIKALYLFLWYLNGFWWNRSRVWVPTAVSGVSFIIIGVTTWLSLLIANAARVLGYFRTLKPHSTFERFFPHSILPFYRFPGVFFIQVRVCATGKQTTCRRIVYTGHEYTDENDLLHRASVMHALRRPAPVIPASIWRTYTTVIVYLHYRSCTCMIKAGFFLYIYI